MSPSKKNKLTPKIPQKTKKIINQKLDTVSPELRLFALKLVGGNQQSAANDLYQETALAVITHADKYRHDTNFKGWAKTIMRNIFIDNYRKQKRFRQVAPIDSEQSGGVPAKLWIKNNVHANVGYKELTAMINSLPDTLKRPFWMIFEGYKYYEIAEALDAPIGTIKSRIFDARQRLMNLYAVRYSL